VNQFNCQAFETQFNRQLLVFHSKYKKIKKKASEMSRMQTRPDFSDFNKHEHNLFQERKPQMQGTKIRLIVTDVDGCLTEERSRPFDLGLITQIKEFNDKSRQFPEIYPPITLCTGRPQPYAEALLKTIGAPLPAITENGGIIYDLLQNTYDYEEKFDANWALKLFELRKIVISKILPQFPVRIQPGKETHLTLITANPKQTRELLAAQLNSHLDDFFIDETESHLNIVPCIFDKGTGFQKLVRLTQIPAEEIAAVGDAEADLAFLKLAGFPMCPGNAASKVKEQCRYVSRQTYTAGLIEIIEKCVAFNRGEWQF